MMLLLTVFYSIPEFDVSNFFLMNCSSDKLNGIGNVSSLNEGGVSGVSGASAPQDSERIRLKAPGTSGPRYTQQINETNELGVSFFCFKYTFQEITSIISTSLEIHIACQILKKMFLSNISREKICEYFCLFLTMKT